MKFIMILTGLMISINMLSIKVTAQHPHTGIYAHALYAAPLDKSSSNLYNGGFGGEAGLLIGRKNTMLNGCIGYIRFFSDNINIYGDQTYVPVKAGIRQYIPITLHFLFVQGNAGIGFVNSQNPGNDGSRFAFDFGAGVKFTAFEAALVWDNYHETAPEGWASWFTVRAGINLSF